MVVEGIPIQQLWALLKWLPNFFLKRKFKPDTLAGLVYVDLRPRGDSATLNLGRVASFELWLQVINLSPFEIELDRADFNLRCGPVLRVQHSRRQKIAPGEIASLWLSGSMTDGEADEIAAGISANNPIGLDGHMDFNCALQPFAKTVQGLYEIRPRVINLQVRRGPV